MMKHSTREAAKKLGISHETLAKYVALGKVPAPEIVKTSSRVIHLWTDAEIEHVRQLLPRIANGRKTRYQKLRAVQKKDAQKQKAQTKRSVPRKRKKKT